MLSDEQRAELTDRAAHAIRRADGNHDTGAGSLGEHVAEELAELVEQWIGEAAADAIERGDVPTGYVRVIEYGGFGFDPAVDDEPCCVDPDRTLIEGHHPTIRKRTDTTGPWQEVEQ